MFPVSERPKCKTCNIKMDRTGEEYENKYGDGWIEWKCPQCLKVIKLVK